MLSGKKIVLAVTGSIAAYKSALLVRSLVKAGAHVKVVMTNAAHDFITPLTLATLSKNPVVTDFISSKESGTWNNHVELGMWADILVVAPASANSIAKMANGITDNLFSAVYLSAKCPVVVAPAMDLDMWKHASTKNNIEKLNSYGNIILHPGNGELASGLIGEGRMAEPEEIFTFLQNYFSKKKKLAGKKVLITAGPTYEALDPVRFIGNYSSGKMGIALAEAALEMGAEVTLICGPSKETCSDKINRVNVVSAADMLKACKKYFTKSDITVMSAAVADFRPKKFAKDKIKKQGLVYDMPLPLESTEDILKYLGEHKTAKQLLVGFALETNNEMANAKKKLRSKKLDHIVLNSLRDRGAGFNTDTNKITLISKSNKIRKFELMTKPELARILMAIFAGEKK